MKKISVLSLAIFYLIPTMSYAQIYPEDKVEEKEYFRCAACHTIKEGGRHKVGPNLFGIFGKEAGTNPTYSKFSKEIKESGIIWTEDTVDMYIANSKKFIPGNKMASGRIKDKKVRDAIIAYMKTFQ